jgi:hypothetical protein
VADIPARPGNDEEASRRLARIKLEQLDDYESALRHAEQLRSLGPNDLPSLSAQMAEVERRRHRLSSSIGGHLSPRWRPKQIWRRWDEERPRAHVFIDETGLTRGHDSAFPYFATAAVIIADSDLATVNATVHDWQRRWIGSSRYVHEMDIRKATGAFYFNGDTEVQARAFDDYRELLSSLPYTVVAVVIDKQAFRVLHPDGSVDGYLPSRLYPLSVQMLFERVVHCLYGMTDSRGLVEAEGIGETEDALLQQTFADLKLRGTRYLKEAWFQYQLRQHVAFYGKSHNRPGLQLADWIVKPCADAVATAKAQTAGSLASHHRVWDVVRTHLYDGNQGRPDKFGLKVYPSAPVGQRGVLFPGMPVEDEVDWDPEKLKGLAANAGDP